MEDATKIWLAFMGLMSVLILSFSLYSYYNNQNAFNLGYCESQKIGSDGTVWVKCAK